MNAPAMSRSRLSLAVLLLAAAGATSSVAQAQSLINISGATLFENFFKAPASTNDYIDVDGNGVPGIFGSFQQLAPFNNPPLSPPAQIWAVQYRSTGSGNGVGELFSWGQAFATTPTSISQAAGIVANAYYNRTNYITPTGPQGIANINNPGAAPFVTDTTTGTTILTSGGGIRMDLAIVDVPTAWFVRTAGTANPFATPGSTGYGTFSGLGKTLAGATNTTANTLRALSAAASPTNAAYSYNLYNPSVTPDANTVFDSPIASATIGVLSNLGTGLTQIDTSDLRSLSTTGRMTTGENLMFATRNAGSGTRNGFSNSIMIDPSWGVGENIGVSSVDPTFDMLGAAFIPSFKNGSGAEELTVGNHRLCVGYAGMERAIDSPAFLATGKVEVLAVRNSLVGGTVYTRPNIDAILDNGPNGYNIEGPETFASIGDPKNQNEVGGVAGNSNPRLRNPAAAAYVNNITRSINAFAAAPGADATVFSPGEFLATKFVLVSATDFVPNPLNPTQLVANPALNQPLQDYTRANSNLGGTNVRVFGTGGFNGKVPARLATATYTDGVASGVNYIDMAGNPINGGANLNDRNRISGDFDGNGVRDIADITEMMKAARFRATNGVYAWTPVSGTGPIAGAPGSTLSIEIIGDFNGDGNFNRHDIRYFADGLAIATSGIHAGSLDRKASFTDVDNAWLAIGGGSNNYFGTTLATGKPYAAGDSRGDIANSTGNVTPGFSPLGAEGAYVGVNPVPLASRNVINAIDINYVYKQFKQNPRVTDGALNWSNLSEATGGDLSADMTGDLVVDQADVLDLVGNILKTTMGDVNLDGYATCADRAIATASLGQPGLKGWADGDVNGDGTVTQADLDIINRNLRCSPADIADDAGNALLATGDNPGSNSGVNEGDYNAFFNNFFTNQAVGSPADIADDAGNPLPPFGPAGSSNSGVNEGDYNAFFNTFFNGCQCN
ncbi:hypothetical protein BH11PLA1_BH11PLA1_12300 [soil metagenome]